MKDDTAVSIENLSKSYKMYGSPVDRFKEFVHPLKKTYHRKFRALQDISFDIPKGTTFAIVGQNGSGKSTLLQIISGILRPTTGSVNVRGRISALLELGAGFHMEFTGRENVFMQGAIMGVSREEMEKHFDRIANFADIGNFLDQPVKTYSGGMYVRLAFATAINVNPDILIIDEVLAVGDDMFKRRCYRKLEEFQEQGKTILFVSHNLPTVTAICNRAVLLDKGKVVQVGTPKDVVDTYSKLLAEREIEYARRQKDLTTINEAEQRLEEPSDSSQMECRYGTRDAVIKELTILDSQGKTTTVLKKGERYNFRVTVEFKKDITKPAIGVSILTLTGIEISGTSTMVAKYPMKPVEADTKIVAEFEQRVSLNPNSYSVNVSVAELSDGQRVFLDRRLNMMTFKVIGSSNSYGLTDLDTKIRVKELGQKQNYG